MKSTWHVNLTFYIQWKDTSKWSLNKNIHNERKAKKKIFANKAEEMDQYLEVFVKLMGNDPRWNLETIERNEKGLEKVNIWVNRSSLHLFDF